MIEGYAMEVDNSVPTRDSFGREMDPIARMLAGHYGPAAPPR